MKYKTNFFIRNANDDLVDFGEEEVKQFVSVINEHIASKCGFIISPNHTIDVKSATFDKTDGSITVTLMTNIKDKYLVTSVIDVMPYCPNIHKKILAIFQGSSGQKVTYESDVATKA